MENRYTNSQAAELLGTTKNTLYRWEKRRASGDPKYKDYPAPRRVAHSNHRFYTDRDIELIKAWKDRTIEPDAAAGVRGLKGGKSEALRFACR